MKKNPRIEITCPSCKKIFLTTEYKLLAGRGKYCSRSCGARVNSFVHGHATHTTQSRTYHTWSNMLARCNNPKSTKYFMYGALGIKADQNWLSFSSFLADMGERPYGTTLDRIDGKLGYFKENCRWATPSQQQRNIKRNVMIKINGREQCLEDWSKEIGISPATLSYRISKKWSDKDLLLQKHGRKKNKPLIDPSVC